MKEDAPAPQTVPKKRRQIEQAPDLWIATWLARDDLSFGERKRLEEERARRKAKEPHVSIGIIVSNEGLTPQQFDRLEGLLMTSGATEIHHAGLASRAHMICRRTHLPVIVEDGSKEVIKASTTLIAFPKESGIQPYSTPGVWSMIGYARNRRLPVKIVFPSGEVK